MFPSDPVRILRVSNQPPFPSTTTIPPFSINLTYFDLLWHPHPPIRRVLFYNTNTDFPTLVNKLKTSLSIALQHFYPLAGKLVWSPENDEPEIRCGDRDDGVQFMEAETDVDFDRLVNEGIHNVDVYRKLVPCLDISELPAPLLSVQVTRFITRGGICLGVSGHHMAMDGVAFWHFMKSWAEICRSGEMMMVKPCHNRMLMQETKGLCKSFHDVLRASLPKVKIDQSEWPEIARRTFMVSASNILSLKEKALKQQSQPNLVYVSTFVAISAHAWLCSVRARQIHEEGNAIFLFLADCRSQLEPPMEQGYFGNCVKPGFVQAKVSDLLGESGFGFAVAAIKKATREKLGEHLKDHKNPPGDPPPSSVTFMTVASSPRFRVYDTDFGWGRPSRVELASMNGAGSMVLAEKRDEEGGLQVSMALAPPHMEEFAKLFLDG